MICISCNNGDKLHYGQRSRVLKDRIPVHEIDLRLNKLSHFPNYLRIQVTHSESNYNKRSRL